MGLGGWVMVAAGVAVIAVALVVLGRARSHDSERRSGASLPTRYVTGLGLAIVGYHLVAHGLPASWVPLKVPVDRFWILGAALIAALGASKLIDSLEGPAVPTDDDSEPERPGG